MVAPNIEMEEVLRRVAQWPAAVQLRFARRVLEALETGRNGDQKTRGAPVEDVLGMLATGGPVPDDDECRRILEEELLKKYAQ